MELMESYNAFLERAIVVLGVGLGISLSFLFIVCILWYFLDHIDGKEEECDENTAN